MPDELRIDERLAIPLSEIELRASRSSGPGGQHANVTASRVEAVFDVARSAALDDRQRERLLARAGATVTAVAQDARGQSRNRELALQRLAQKIAAGLAIRAAAVRPGRPRPPASAGLSRSAASGNASAGGGRRVGRGSSAEPKSQAPGVARMAPPRSTCTTSSRCGHIASVASSPITRKAPVT